MFLFNKRIDGEYAKFGINYRSEDDGTEIVIKIPLWVFWRENYLDFGTYNYKSGKTVQSFMIYIRRRSDNALLGCKYIPYRRWIFDCMFGLTPYGKQKTMLRWDRGSFVRAEGFFEANVNC